MRSWIRPSSFLVAAALALTACGDLEITTLDPSATDIDLNGFWAGTAAPGVGVDLTLQHDTLTDEVRGIGALIRTGGSQAFRVEGLVDDTRDIITLLLELSTPSLGGETSVTLVHYRARPFGPDRLTGTLNGGGFNSASLMLQRIEDGVLRLSSSAAAPAGG